MSDRILLKEKKHFVQWLMENFQMKRRESTWILNYLINHDIVMNKTKFVENVESTPRGIKIAVAGTDDESFAFYKQGQTLSPEQAFHEIRLNWHTDLFLEVIFNNRWLSPEYLSVIEDNPYSKWNETIPDEVSQQVDEALSQFHLIERKQDLLKEIDSALENAEKDSFIELTRELKEIDNELTNGALKK